MASSASPEVLVSTAWVAEHLSDARVRLVEVDVDTQSYEAGHVRGALAWNWNNQLCDTRRRDIIGKGDFENLMGESGIAADTTVVIYGDNNNWFAAWAFWQMKIYGHRDVRLMDGGRKKWEMEQRDLVQEKPPVQRVAYKAKEPDLSIRAFRDEVFQGLDQKNVNLVDVRSADEYTGKIIAPPGLPETAQRAGHIPGAVNIPWSKAVKEDGSFRSVEELRALYEAKGVSRDRSTIAYCRIGERSSHTWFVLKYLLGHPNVKNYDGSWTEWGNLVDAPIER
ncbi:MAG: sulfurtransferase [Planctomycetes bacterium]|nr:sulfurtransferase [Planctomycetota bacterium]